MRRLLRLVAGLAALIAAACSPLAVFDAAVPKDRGGRLVVDGAAYGTDPRQRIDLYAPRTPGAKPLPVIVFFYGGSWNSGARGGYAFVGRALAARGFVVAIPDYRLVPQVRYPAFVADGAAAVRWVRGHAREAGGDPDRIVIAGHSAGAYIAAMLAIDPRWLGADRAGPRDPLRPAGDRAAVRGLIGLAGPYDFLPFDGPVTQAAFGNARDPAATQPVNHVAPGDPPALLATGDQDTTVRPANSDALAARLRAVGTPVERVRYPGLGHVGVLTAIARPFRGRAPVLADMAAFADRVTR